jgi:hypothetical protein
MPTHIHWYQGRSPLYQRSVPGPIARKHEIPTSLGTGIKELAPVQKLTKKGQAEAERSVSMRFDVEFKWLMSVLKRTKGNNAKAVKYIEEYRTRIRKHAENFVKQIKVADTLTAAAHRNKAAKAKTTAAAKKTTNTTAKKQPAKTAKKTVSQVAKNLAETAKKVANVVSKAGKTVGCASKKAVKQVTKKKKTTKRATAKKTAPKTSEKKTVRGSIVGIAEMFGTKPTHMKVECENGLTIKVDCETMEYTITGKL